MARLSLLFILPLMLGGCETASEIFSKKAPDEFRILTRTPLKMPPNDELKAPPKGIDVQITRYTQGRSTPQSQAKEALFGKKTDTNITASEAALLQKAGAHKAPQNIAAHLDRETAKRVKYEESILDDVLFWRDPPGSDPLDIEKEKKRLAKTKKKRS